MLEEREYQLSVYPEGTTVVDGVPIASKDRLDLTLSDRSKLSFTGSSAEVPMELSQAILAARQRIADAASKLSTAAIPLTLGSCKELPRFRGTCHLVVSNF